MLSDIIKRQKQDVALLNEKLSFHSLKDGLEKSKQDFLAHLLATKTGFIFECKFKSPSEGKLKESYPITQIANTYAKYANAISVLTNEPFFGGSLEHLAQVKQAVSIPILCKDIIVSPYQVALARHYGADAVLLMLSVLDDKDYLTCKALAHALNMTILTEVYSQEELERAKSLEANIIVVNHRDLKTMKLDMNRIDTLAPQFPQNAYIIAASGLQSHQDIQPLLTKVNGFLIGSSLMKSNNMLKTIHDFIYGPIKICGLTTKEDAQLAYERGASYGGLIFAANSKRKISLEQARTIVQTELNYIGVFVNQDITEIINIAKTLNLSAIQLHGQEDANTIAAIRQQLPPKCQIWKAIDGNIPLPKLMPIYVDKLLIDNKIGQKFGGTGKSFNWHSIKSHPLLKDIMLSGGIDTNNVLEAKRYGSWGIDVNSGVESSPGIKDRAKLELFFQTLKQGYNHANA